ncbi:MAG: peptide deformylase [Bacteroidales bacterium]|nr:peptide deformylase [Bacteroidales bacterium]MBN2761679.1 peptide deformylase [Bacteroidales bacterium]
MTHPIVVYGSPVLRKMAVDIDRDYEGLSTLIADMFDSMDESDGMGLAAPQIGKSIRLFVTDGSSLVEDDPSMIDFKKVYINARLIKEEGEPWAFNEGCLSIPNIREDVMRKPRIRVQYNDENWQFHDEYFEGVKARIIQHEYDHTDGILFIDRISPIRRKLLKGKLNDISKGKVKVDYKIKVLK